MTKATYYIGSNNTTKKLERAKAVKILARHYAGFTLSDSIGFWKGVQETSLRVEVLTALKWAEIEKIGKQLARELKQEAVLVELTRPRYSFAN